jgi:hypothetical protein
MILVPEYSTRVNDKFILDESINCTIPQFSISHPLIQGLPNSIDTRYQASFYKKIAIDIVTESVFDYPYPYVSEKTLRPIACKRMFIIMGPKNILKLLHDKGFETFSDFLDESYDDISCPMERFKKIIQTTKEFIRRPLDDIKDYYIQNQKRFDHNFQVLSNIRSQELIALELRIKKMELQLLSTSYKIYK